MRQLLFLYVSFSAEVNIKTKFKTLLIKYQQFRQGGQKVGWFYSKKLLLDKK